MTSGLLTVLYLLGQLQLEIIINITFEDCSFLKSVRFRETGKKLRNNLKENKTNFGNQTAAKFASEKQSSLLLSSHSFHFYLD